MVTEVARAIAQLGVGSACCGIASAFGRKLPATTVPLSSRDIVLPKPRATKFVLPRVYVIDPGEPPREADVVIAAGKIEEIAPAGSAAIPGYLSLAECTGAFVAPGLVDMHTHLPSDNVLQLTGLFLLLHLAHGVTTVRDAGDLDGTAVPAARRGFEAGLFVGPRIAAAMAFIGRGRPRWPNTVTLHSPDDAPAIARQLRQSGADCMKLYENLEPADIAALERAATEQGLTTLGHVPSRLGIEEAGLRDAQHFFGVAPPGSLLRDHVLDRTAYYAAVGAIRLEEVVRCSVEQSIANTPTLVLTDRLVGAGADGLGAHPSASLLPSFFRDVVWSPKIGLPAYRSPSQARVKHLRHALETKLELVRRLHREGARLHLGTDVQQPFVVPGAALHDEMRLFVRAGIPARDVLRMATRDAAQALGWNELGTVRKRAPADLIVCAADPSADIEALDTLRAVIRDGNLFDVAALREAAVNDVARRDRFFSRIASDVLARLSMRRLTSAFTN